MKISAEEVAEVIAPTLTNWVPDTRTRRSAKT